MGLDRSELIGIDYFCLLTAVFDSMAPSACSGQVEPVAEEMLLSYGYSNVTSLSGGFGGWVDAGYPVVEYAMP